MSTNRVRVTVWGEFRHERRSEEVRKIYPEGMHETIAAALRKADGLEVTAAHLDQPEHGLTEERLKRTDVLTWWGHLAHDDVQQAIADRVHQRVMEGMGMVFLHSADFPSRSSG